MTNRPAYERNFFKDAFKKILKPTIIAVQSFLQDGAFKIRLSYVDTDLRKTSQYEADIRLISKENKKGIDFEISIADQLRNGGVKYANSYGLQNALEIYKEGLTLITGPHAIDNFECNFPAVPRILSGVLSNLRTANKPYDNSFFRMCIPVNDGDIVYPTEIISNDKHLKFDIRHWDTQPSLIGMRFPSIKGMYVALTIQDRPFHFYAVEDMKCIFIDSLEKMHLADFKRISADIRLAFAFLSSRHYGPDTFILTSKDKNFQKIADVAYTMESEGVRGNQQLINPTMLFTFYRDMELSETFRPKFEHCHDRFSNEVFGCFCDQLHTNPVLRRAVEILVSSSSVNDPLQQGILGSVSLETITELIAGENNDRVNPIPDRPVARQLIAELKKYVLDKQLNITEEGLATLNSKLSDLNKPTNRNKLLFPFKYFGLKLSKADEEILNHRNDFLHGRTPVEHTAAWEMEQIALRLHYLAGIVILKYIGYTGHVMNLSAWTLFNNQEKMLATFSRTDNKMLIRMREKAKKGEEFSEHDYEVLEDTARLSTFMESIIEAI